MLEAVDVIEPEAAGSDSLAITGSACEGTGDFEELEIEVTRTEDGITLARGADEESLVRCE